MLLSAVKNLASNPPPPIPVHIKLKHTPGLFLTGFMGAGKSTTGPILADKLGWGFKDLDSVIEENEGAPVPLIFATQGEATFRRMEHAALRQLIVGIQRGKPLVVALGGGAFPDPANFDLLTTSGITVWLDCSFETAFSRVASEGNRPLAKDPGLFRQLFDERRIAYARADYRVDAEADPEAVAFAILGLPLWK